MKKIVMVLFIAGLVVFIGYMALNCYANFIEPQLSGSSAPREIKMPEVETAQYELQIYNTGNVILTDSVDILGKIVGKRKFVLHGYWELQAQSFIYNESDRILDEALFGKITLSRREHEQVR